MKSVAIITARGGSKRIPRKNVRPFLGCPIIKYSIDAALEAGCFDEVMVSTEDQEIARIAKECGAVVPFFRSEQTSNDFATTADVILEVLSEYRQRGCFFDFACCIYPTAPFLSGTRLREGFDLLRTSEAKTLFPVVRFSYPIQRALVIQEGKLSMMHPEHIGSRSQDLIPAYHDAGQFYWLRVEPFLADPTLFTDHTSPLVLSEQEVQDIDNEEDWRMAELKYRIIRGL